MQITKNISLKKKVHQLSPDPDSEQTYLEGTIVEILGVELFNNVE